MIARTEVTAETTRIFLLETSMKGATGVTKRASGQRHNAGPGHKQGATHIHTHIHTQTFKRTNALPYNNSHMLTIIICKQVRLCQESFISSCMLQDNVFSHSIMKYTIQEEIDKIIYIYFRVYIYKSND